MTNDLKWFFGHSASEKHGPNDSITTTFKGDKYYSLAREVLQNSVDAIDDKNKPVRVTFSCFELKKSDLIGFWELQNNIHSCQEYFSTHKKFVEFCNEGEIQFKEDKIKCLKISDFNTTGLEYSDGTESKFFGFIESVGVTNKSNSGAGGSFGFGKGAYYAASSVRTIIVSSVYGDNRYIFQGKARLTTHKDSDGNLKDYTGLFGAEGGKAVMDVGFIPEVFRREEKGTDITIMGFQDANDWKESLVKSVLNNFWLAIWEEKLIVDIEGTIISKDTLESIISTFYSADSLDGSINDPETWNPYPYFKAVKFIGDTNTRLFEDELETLGSVKLYLYLKDGLQNRTIYLRSPKMVVDKKTHNRGFDYAGVFVCDNEKGNEILRQMENPQHNEWKKNNYLETDKPHPDAKKAEDELKSFVKKCLETLMDAESGRTQNITGLDEYLNIPEDLIPEKAGNGEATGSGDVSNEKTDQETAVEITQKEKEVPVTLQVKKKTEVINTDEGEISDDGEILVITGKGCETDLPVEPNPNFGDIPGTFPQLGTEIGNEPIKRLLNVKWRVIAQRNSANEIEHLLKIFSVSDANAEIELFAGVDNDGESDDGMLSIVSAVKDGANLSSKGNKITNISLINGWNMLKVKFDSNQKHSLKIKSYEI